MDLAGGNAIGLSWSGVLFSCCCFVCVFCLFVCLFLFVLFCFVFSGRRREGGGLSYHSGILQR